MDTGTLAPLILQQNWQIILIVFIYVIFIILFLWTSKHNKLKSLLYWKAYSVDVRFFHIQIFSGWLSILILPCIYLIFKKQIDNGITNFDPLYAYIIILIAPLIALIFSWLASGIFCYTWNCLDADNPDTDPALALKYETVSRIKKNKYAHTKAELDEEAQFTLRYAHVVRAVNSLNIPPSPNERIHPKFAQTGYHLCLSTDHELIKANKPHALLFQRSQYEWCQRYVELNKTDPGPVYIIPGRDSSGNLATCNEYNILDRAIRSSSELWHDNFIKIQNDIDLKGNGFKDPCNNSTINYNQNFIYPRAVRLVFSSLEDILTGLYDHYKKHDFESWVLTGPNSGIFNIWIPIEARNKMKVDTWKCNGRASNKLFYDGLFNQDGTSSNISKIDNNLLNLDTIINNFYIKWDNDKIMHRDMSRILKISCLPVATPTSLGTEASSFLCVGGKCTMIGAIGEVYNNKKWEKDEDQPWHRRAFLDALPTVLMAMHCKKTLPFDWLYRVVLNNDIDHKNELVAHLSTQLKL